MTENAPRSEPLSVDPGTLLDGTPYRYVGELGGGAMGQVLEAEHTGLGTRVVVKVLHAHLADRVDPADRARTQDRMRLEAQALARLEHPNLLKVTDFGVTAAGRTYLVSERLRGRTLRAEMEERGSIPVLEAITMACQVLGGLSIAHGAGIVHRDIKPDNLFVCDPLPGAPPHAPKLIKVLDFGLAKVVAAAQSAATPAALMVPTDEGTALGTPRFMSPEQALGKREIDHRADLYCLGCVIYTMVARRGPFDHVKGLYEMMRAQTSEQPAPPSAHAPQPIPPELDQAILRALAKKPVDRFQTAREFADELARISRLASVPQVPLSPMAPAARTSAPGPQPTPDGNRWDTTEPLETLLARTAKPLGAQLTVPQEERKAVATRGTVRMPDAASTAEDAAAREREKAAIAARGTVRLGDAAVAQDASRDAFVRGRGIQGSPAPVGATIDVTALDRASSERLSLGAVAEDRMPAPAPAPPASYSTAQLVAIAVMGLMILGLVAAIVIKLGVLR